MGRKLVQPLEVFGCKEGGDMERGRKEENEKGDTEGWQQVAKEKEGRGEEWKKNCFK